MWAHDRIVLHVDDDPQTQQELCEPMRLRGYELVPERDPLEVLSRIVREEFRVILLDIDMPKMDGMDLLRQIKSFDGGIQTVLLTGMVSQRTLLRAQRYGAETCLFKPLFETDRLAEALDDAFRRIDRWSATFAELRDRRKAVAPSLYSATLESGAATAKLPQLSSLSV